MVEFELTEEDEYAINIAIEAARLFLKERELSPKKIIGLGNALYALERLPVSTEGVLCGFGLFYSFGSEEFSESKYFDFRITEDLFEFSIGGSVYEKSVGSDSFSEPGWLIEKDGEAIRDADLYYLSEHIRDYLNQGAEVVVDDDSDIKFE